tara:strand:+ start:87 stop:401 length:315 start_codon:yes stop_codon:yes gene_type:complete
MYDFIGYIAIFLASVSLMPQIYQMIKTKQVRDLNIYFLFTVLLADILYFTYGIINSDKILYLSTIPPCISHTIIIILWFYYQNYLCCKYPKNINTTSGIDTVIL